MKALKKIKTYNIILVQLLLLFNSCSKDWETHYHDAEESVNIKLWDTIKTIDRFSEFTKYLELYHLDTLLKHSNSKTIFIPTNEAFNEFLNSDTTGMAITLKYHIVNSYFMLQKVKHNYRLKTLSEKYAFIENYNNVYLFDGIPITGSSPLFLDGKLYEINEVARPKPNLYQYISWNNPAIRKYIDLQDSVILDILASKPVGINENGETVYDSVLYVENGFEQEYFGISKEYSNLYATMVLPDSSNYNAALDAMAQNLGSGFNSYRDIPEEWQNVVLIPQLLHKGTYGGFMDPLEFQRTKIANINGDSILIDFEIDAGSKTVGSNGIVYNYASFSVPRSMYENSVLEGESLCMRLGSQTSWDMNKVKLVGNNSFQPIMQKIAGASNDTVINVEFGKKYNGEYAITFKIKNVFPRIYRFVWKTNYRVSGIYSIYVNGEKILLGNPDFYGNSVELDIFTLDNRQGFHSMRGYKIWPSTAGYLELDGKVTNLTEFGDVEIKIEYRGPGKASINGLNMDYIALLPIEN